MKPAKMKKLPRSFYLRPDVITIAKELLGKVLVTTFDKQVTAGRIVETEAYEGESDKASHASKGRTGRTEVMYGEGGTAYVYLCYGIHQMFNIVTAARDVPHAVLVRAVEPITGLDIMQQRTGNYKTDSSLTSGPGKIGKAFGFHTSQCGISLISDEIHIADDGYALPPSDIISSPRVGVAYAGEHAAWHYRFFIKGNKYVSKVRT